MERKSQRVIFFMFSLHSNGASKVLGAPGPSGASAKLCTSVPLTLDVAIVFYNC